MDHDCKQEVVIDMIREDLREIKHDVKSLLKTKWHFLGMSAIMGGVLYVIVFLVKIL